MRRGIAGRPHDVAKGRWHKGYELAEVEGGGWRARPPGTPWEADGLEVVYAGRAAMRAAIDATYVAPGGGG